jgi:fused signal recognition particle receptor
MLVILILIAVLILAVVAGGTVLAVTQQRRRRAKESGAAATVEAPPKPTPRPKAEPAAPATPRAPPEAAPPVLEEAAPEVVEEVEAPPAVEEVEEVVVERATFRSRLGKARGLFSGMAVSVRGRGIDADTWDDLEEALLRADVGVATTDALLEDLRSRVKAERISQGDQLISALRQDLVAVLDRAGETDGKVDRALHTDPAEGVTNVWLFVGVNGVGKTTTVGKVARQQSADGRSVLLAAGDTFRAAAAEQLTMWADRVGAEVVRGAEGGDPSAVVFDAVQRAAARGNDLVLADTAGRLHTKVNLVEELKKIRRVADREPGRVSEVLLVLDATTGQNGLVQARQFTDAVEVTGVVLTKLDGTAKGGVVVAVQRELGIPVKLVGLGEGADDLVPFDATEFVDALFD